MSKPHTISECVVVGGGIIGLLTARELHRAGVRVTVYDRQPAGRESSWAGGGILSPLYPWRYPEAVLRLARWSQQRYPELLRSLADSSGVDPEYIQSGLLINVANELNSASKWIENQDIEGDILHNEQVATLQLGLQVGEDPWLWLPKIGQVRNPCLIAALRSELALNGVKIIENVAISGFIHDDNGLTGIVTDAGNVATNACLVAAGAWSGDLLSSVGIRTAIKPMRGQMLLLRGEPGQVKHMVLKDAHYLIPRRDGRILVGSTLEDVGFDKSSTAAAREELTEAAESIIPGLVSSCEVEQQWAGLRPGSPHGIPYMGEHPDIAGLYVSSGHYRNGFVLAPASARLMTDLVLGRKPLFDLEDYRLEREPEPVT